MVNMGKTLLLLGLPLAALGVVGASGEEKIVTRKYNPHKERAAAKRVDPKSADAMRMRDRTSATIISIEADPAHTSSMYKACTSYSEIQVAGAELKQDLGTKGAVKVTVSNSAADLACFTFSAPLKYGDALVAEPGTKHLESVNAIARGSRKLPSAAAHAKNKKTKNKKTKNKKHKPFRKADRELQTTSAAPLPPGCVVPTPSYIGDGDCDGSEYATEVCGYDGGDCPVLPPGCVVVNPEWIGDGDCDGGAYAQEVCGYDGGDCPVLPPGCVVDFPENLGDDDCDGGEYATEACGYDGGDCPVLPPGCVVDDPTYIGDDFCDGGEYNTEVCEFDGGDCITPSPEAAPTPSPQAAPTPSPVGAPTLPPGCDVFSPDFIGNGVCDGGVYASEACEFDGGDCVGILPPGCTVEYPSYIGDGTCDLIDDGAYNSEVCEFDGGDCIGVTTSSPAPAPVLPPGCVVDTPSWIGDGDCDGGVYATEVCEFDGGDCVGILPPGCVVDFPSYIGDGYCDRGDYNTELCEFDGGDCIGVTTSSPAAAPVLPPGCVVDIPSWIGDGICDRGDYNTEVCEFDGGDCIGASTFSPTAAPDTFAPSPASDTLAPSPASDTLAPSPASDTLAPSPASDTLAPSPASDTLAPSPASDTLAPSPASDTLAPSPAGSEAPSSGADGSGGCITASDCYDLATPTDMAYLDDNHKELYCDPTCSEEGTSFDGILCNFFGLGQDCRACFLEAGAQQFLTNNPTLTCNIINMCAGEPACEEVEP